MERVIIFSGTANPALAQAIAAATGFRLGEATVTRFPDGEVGLELGDTVVGRTVILVQPTSPPVDEHLVELLAFVDACRRAGAARIIAVVPYFGYARSDRRGEQLVPIAASMVANILRAVGVDQVVAVDLHSGQVEGYFQIPVENLSATFLLADAMRGSLPADTVIVSPDAGRYYMATVYAERLGTDVATLHKQRLSGSETRVTEVVGDVRGRPCLLIDDMITTGGTIAHAATALQEHGAAGIMVAATHGLFVADARQRLEDAGISEVWVTDTVASTELSWANLHIVPVAPLIAPILGRLTQFDT